MVAHSSTMALSNLVQATMVVALSSTTTQSSSPIRSSHTTMVAPCSTMARSLSRISTKDRSRLNSSSNQPLLWPNRPRITTLVLLPPRQIVAVPEHRHWLASSVQSAPVPHGRVLSMTHPPASPSVASSYNMQYPEVHMVRRYPVNSPFLRQDPVLPLFFCERGSPPVLSWL
jgi:hypothetical protein